LCNRAEINDKQAMVFFIGGLEVEIKNLVKMFEPKTLKQAYNLARLQNKTLSYRRSHPTQIRHYTQTITTIIPEPFEETKPTKHPCLKTTPSWVTTYPKLHLQPKFQTYQITRNQGIRR